MKKAIIFGLGISGKSAVKFLLEQNFQILAGDDNSQSLSALNEFLNKEQISQNNLQIFENISEIDWENTQFLVLSPGIALQYPHPHPIVLAAKKHSCPIICDVEILYLFNQKSNFIGITGTNGKSTTTALIGHIFEQSDKKIAIGGNIGNAALSLEQFGDNGNYVIEMSSYQLDLIAKSRFNIASLLNITPDHLERHKDMDGYIKAKKRIFLNQKKGDFALINIDDSNCQKIYQDLKDDNNWPATAIAISTQKIIEDGLAIIDDIIYNNLAGQKSTIKLEKRDFLPGNHNVQNIAFAFANCFLAGIDVTIILNAIASFKGLKHRMQLVKTINNINFINDSKATNSCSTKNALEFYDNIYWILGGKAKNGGIDDLKKYFPKIKYAFLIGEASEDFAQILDGKIKFLQCGDLQNAVKKAYEIAKKDNLKPKNILLSPACASFDQWPNFVARGDFFCKLVENLDN